MYPSSFFSKLVSQKKESKKSRNEQRINEKDNTSYTRKTFILEFLVSK